MSYRPPSALRLESRTLLASHLNLLRDLRSYNSSLQTLRFDPSRSELVRLRSNSSAFAIWSFSATSGLAANVGRDAGVPLGSACLPLRISCLGGSYAALAALTNIPATFWLASRTYELMLSDSDRAKQPVRRLAIKLLEYFPVVTNASFAVINAHKNQSGGNSEATAQVGEVERVGQHTRGDLICSKLSLVQKEVGEWTYLWPLAYSVWLELWGPPPSTNGDYSGSLQLFTSIVDA
ncbi:hypothetical protein R3P38DRAFT_3360885 [Favolaschia claudopus]|uniref:Uncharacterized protein n=1 Tax=Favolaschia claudopus TaxID=2862362 RepID=A0AAW0AVD5_9AGAR